MDTESVLSKYFDAIDTEDPIKYIGRVTKVRESFIESTGPSSIIGEMCRIISPRCPAPVKAEVVGLQGTTVQLIAYDDTSGIEIGSKVVADGSVLKIPVGSELLGRVIDASGAPCDGKGALVTGTSYPAMAPPPDPMSRKPIQKRMVTGVRAIDALLAVGRGQRLGIFAGSGVGKSTLLGMISRNTNADINVIALIGERGREVNDFIENDLGPDGLARSVVVVATSDKPPVARLRGAYVATAIAEYFRDQGKDVMLLFDSVTRFAKAQQDIGFARGEAPAKAGYPASVFELMPKLLERSGTSDRGSITAFYTVLVDGDDMNEPITDTVRSIVDGHIVLSRKLAQQYHYPAIDILASISRLANRVTGPETQKAGGKIRTLMAAYAANEDMINVGAYQKGANSLIDEAIDIHQQTEDFLNQDVNDPALLEDTLKKMSALTGIAIPDEEFSMEAGMLRKPKLSSGFSASNQNDTGNMTGAADDIPVNVSPEKLQALSDAVQKISGV